MKEEIKKYAGVDCAKAVHMANVSDLEKSKPFNNNVKGCTELVKYLQEAKIDCAILEPSGGYESLLCQLLNEHGVKYSLVNPRFVKSFSLSQGAQCKTDPKDAKLLRVYGEKFSPPVTEHKEANLQSLEQHLVRYRQLVEFRTIEKTRIHNQALCSELVELIRSNIAIISKQIKEIKTVIDSKVTTMPSIQDKATLLQSATGISNFSSAYFIVRLPELGTVDRKKIAALVGVAPYNRDSGSMSAQRSIYGGRHDVRSLLYMCTLVALRTNQALNKYYKNLRSRGKGHKKTMVACMRKQITAFNAMLRDNSPWQQDAFLLAKNK